MKFLDSWKTANPTKEESFTYHAFRGKKYVPPNIKDSTRIDYIFFNPHKSWKLISSEIIEDTRTDCKNLYPSDHYPIISSFEVAAQDSQGNRALDFTVNLKWKAG